MALIGLSGTGKTMTALRVAEALKGDKRIAVIDGEHGSSEKYSSWDGETYIGPVCIELPDGTKYEHDFDFDVAEPKAEKGLDYINRLIVLMQNIEALDEYGVLIGDCGSHEWMKLLEYVDQVEQKFTSGWKAATPLHNRWIHTFLSSKIHQIWTFRQKADYTLVEQVNSRGKKVQVPKKVGMAPVARDGTDYEFDVVGTFTGKGVLEITKSRCQSIPEGSVYEYPGEDDLGRQLREWLEVGQPNQVGEDQQETTQ